MMQRYKIITHVARVVVVGRKDVHALVDGAVLDDGVAAAVDGEQVVEPLLE